MGLRLVGLSGRGIAVVLVVGEVSFVSAKKLLIRKESNFQLNLS